jgi:hypothetical protein
MPIELTCPSCGKQLRLADEHAGKAGRCPACQGTFQIPTASQQATPPPPLGGAAFGNTAPTQPFAAPPPVPSGDLFGQPGQQQPNPFASTGSMQSPYGGANPYGSTQTPNMYGAKSSSGEGMATACVILGIVTIISGVLSFCCCAMWIVTFPCGITGIILSFQVPPERRKLGLILNIVGLGITVLVFVASLIFSFAMNGRNFNFNL